ncbi:autotransporter outer membrane beta-barrel domain-containing protein [Parasphingorhabdus sp.]|uniref:autotransporter outer membrane beta-barrel domain-containing protein n=1 Tax=Parasphingorhabdus sp. TaxID=2709688 RepID=UPI003002930D
MQTAAMALNGGVGGNAAVMTDFAAASAAQDVETISNGVNEDIAVYLAGGYLDGEGRSMPLAGQPQGNDEFDGFFIAAGIEHFLSDTSMLGLGFHYTDLDATAALGNTSSGKTITGSLYGRTMIGPLALDAQVTAGVYEATTQRSLALGPQTYTLNSQDDNLLFTSSVDLSYKLGSGGFTFAPTAGMRATKIDFSNVIETGGPMALTTSRPDYDSLQGRAGVEFEGGGGGNVQFFGSGYYVHEFEDAQTNVAANFTNGVGLLAPFALAGQDDDWFEASAGVRVNTGNISFGLSGFTTIKRFDAEARGVSASASIRF